LLLKPEKRNKGKNQLRVKKEQQSLKLLQKKKRQLK
jgi:hypothetical protein